MKLPDGRTAILECKTTNYNARDKYKFADHLIRFVAVGYDLPRTGAIKIVDETSMVNMWLAYQLFARLKSETKVLIAGNADQLESVGAGSVFRELIQCGLVPVMVLDHIFRQAEDSLIAYNAKFIWEGSGQLHYGRDFSLTETESQYVRG